MFLSHILQYFTHTLLWKAIGLLLALYSGWIPKQDFALWKATEANLLENADNNAESSFLGSTF